MGRKQGAMLLSNLFKAFENPFLLPLNARNLSLISNHTAKWMQVFLFSLKSPFLHPFGCLGFDWRASCFVFFSFFLIIVRVLPWSCVDLSSWAIGFGSFLFSILLWPEDLIWSACAIFGMWNPCIRARLCDVRIHYMHMSGISVSTSPLDFVFLLCRGKSVKNWVFFCMKNGDTKWVCVRIDGSQTMELEFFVSSLVQLL